MNNLSIEEQLNKLKEELEELEAERHYQLAQTGVHISAKKVIALREHYDKEIEAIKSKIRELGGTI